MNADELFREGTKGWREAIAARSNPMLSYPLPIEAPRPVEPNGEDTESGEISTRDPGKSSRRP